MLRLVAVTTLIAFSAAPAFAQKLDSQGKCHDKRGYAPASVCAHLKGSADYKLNAAGKCMVATGNVPGKKKGDFAKAEMCAGK